VGSSTSSREKKRESDNKDTPSFKIFCSESHNNLGNSGVVGSHRSIGGYDSGMYSRWVVSICIIYIKYNILG
jgi:hypothetical protein